MITQIPSSHTNIIATVRRDPQQAVADSQNAVQRNIKREDSFQLNADPKVDQQSNNDNFALGGGINLAAVNSSASDGGGSFSKSAIRAASQAYTLAQAFTAISPDRALSVAV